MTAPQPFASPRPATCTLSLMLGELESHASTLHALAAGSSRSPRRRPAPGWAKPPGARAFHCVLLLHRHRLIQYTFILSYTTATRARPPVLLEAHLDTGCPSPLSPRICAFINGSHERTLLQLQRVSGACSGPRGRRSQCAAGGGAALLPQQRAAWRPSGRGCGRSHPGRAAAEAAAAARRQQRAASRDSSGSGAGRRG